MSVTELCVCERVVREGVMCERVVRTTFSHNSFTHTQLLHNSCCHTLTFLLCGRRGTCSPAVSGGAPWSALTPDTPWCLCVASVAFDDIDVPFMWQAWHLVTLTFLLCGQRGTCGTGGTGLALVARLGQP